MPMGRGTAGWSRRGSPVTCGTTSSAGASWRSALRWSLPPCSRTWVGSWSTGTRFTVDVEDWELWIRIAASYRVAVAPQLVLHVRRHSTNSTGAGATASLDAAYRALFDRVFDEAERPAARPGNAPPTPSPSCLAGRHHPRLALPQPRRRPSGRHGLPARSRVGIALRSGATPSISGRELLSRHDACSAHGGLPPCGPRSTWPARGQPASSSPPCGSERDPGRSGG